MTAIHITGGADDYQAAAIVAVIQHVESEAAAVHRLGGGAGANPTE